RDLELVTKDVNSFRERELVAVSTSDIQAVQLSEGKEAGAPAIGLEKSDKGGWRYTAPERFKGGAAETESGTPAGPDAAPTNIQALLGDLTGIKVEGDDFVADNLKDDELGKYNLGPKDEKLFITFKRTEENSKSTEQTLVVGLTKPKPDAEAKAEKA